MAISNPATYKLPALESVFCIHYPLQLQTFRLNHVGSGLGYFDENRTTDGLRLWVDSFLKPQLARWKNRMGGPQGTARLCISGTVVKLLAKFQPAVLIELCAFVRLPSVELVGASYFNSSPAAVSLPEYQEQIARHAACMRNVFQKAPCVSMPGPAAAQLSALQQKLKKIEKGLREISDNDLLENWRVLQDNVYHSEPAFQDSLQNILLDLELRLIRKMLSNRRTRFKQHNLLL